MRFCYIALTFKTLFIFFPFKKGAEVCDIRYLQLKGLPLLTDG